MTTTRRTALLSGFAAITGAFVPRLFRRGLPAPPPVGWGSMFAVDRSGAGHDWNVPSVPVIATWMSAAVAARIREGQLVALRPDGTVGPA